MSAITISGVASVPASALSSQALAWLKASLTVAGRDTEVCAVIESPDTIAVPRGAFRRLAESCPGAPIISAVSLGDPLPPDIRRPDLRPYQEPAARALVSGVQGLLVAACGAGKTEVALAAIVDTGRSALVLVHTGDLADQWLARCRDRLGIEPGLIAEASDTRGPVTVALMQSLIRWTPAAITALARQFGVVVADEAHHCPCKSLSHLLALMPCRWRWGLTATPARGDGLGPLISWIVGPELHRIEHAGLMDAGHLVPARIEYVHTGWTCDPEALAQDYANTKAAEKAALGWSPRSVAGTRAFFAWDGEPPMPKWLWTAIYQALANDPYRNALLLDLILRDLATGHTVLVLCRLKEHCGALARAVTAAGHHAEPLTSDRTRKTRAQILDSFRSQDLHCVTATSLADEGLDVPRLDRVVLASPVRSATATEQRLGRLLRPSPGKAPAVLYDFIDNLGCLKAQAAARRRVYRRILEAT